MISVGLTGNVASGKSTVLELWSEAGIPVVSADELSRRAVEPGSPGLVAVGAAFEGVIDGSGELDRSALRRIVFGDDEARRRLEALLHPRIAVLRDRWLRRMWARDEPVVVSEVPLLFEAQLEDDFDAIVLVEAPEDVRIRRMMESRGLPEEEARAIADAQMPSTEKRLRSDFILENDRGLEELKHGALEVLATLADSTGASAAGSVRVGRMRVDLHMHTRGSFDCLSDPEKVLAKARERGVARIAITDHNKLDVALEMHARYPDRVIPGEEVKTAEGIDVIGLYLKEEIPKGTPAHDVVDIVAGQGGLTYLPHPYASGKGGGGAYAEELAPRMDVIEVFNARLHPGRLNEPAEELAARHDKPRGAGSDAHTVGEVAGGFVEVPEHANEPAALLGVLKASAVRGATTPWAVHLASTWAKIRKRLP